MRHFARAALALLLACSPLIAQVQDGKKLVDANLYADTTAIVPGKPFRVGVVLRMAPGWHVYWQNPGDAGYATKFDLELPEGFVAGPIEWPLPQRLLEPGDIQVYAYRGETMLVRTVTPPAEIEAGTVTIRAKASWLVCEVNCIPGKTAIEAVVPVAPAAAAAPHNQELFERYAAQLPSEEKPPFGATWTPTPTGWNLSLSGLGDATKADFFPFADDAHPAGHTAPKDVSAGSADLSIPVAGSASVEGIAVVESATGRRGWQLSSASSPAPSAPAAQIAPPQSAARTQTGGLWTNLLLGFLGGLILNLMPCVLPVISLKIFGFMRQAGDSRASILRHGLAFCAGIFVWFLGLAAVVVALKSAGHQVTWAFQFQNPWFNFFVGAIVFLFALNLFGVFEITLPGRAATGLAEASSRGGVSGSFAQGIFATLLATPCTAPFLGSALGYAFSQTPAVILAMFASVAAGMSLPYIALSAQPAWLKYLPKPGDWMERLKQFMAFPLLATLLWLLYIIGQQRGTDAVIYAAAAYLCLGLVAWLYGAFLGPLANRRARILAALAIALVLIFGAGSFLKLIGAQFRAPNRPNANAGSVHDPEKIPWVPYSPDALAKALAEKRPVFLDFTADWCLTCKFNERTAIDTPAVRGAFAELGVVPMKADWTNSDPDITTKLAEFGRVGVPFYLFYPAGSDRPETLPELLTEQIVLRAIGAKSP